MSLSLKVLVSVSLQSAVCSLRSAVCGLRSAVCGLRSAVCGLRSAGLRSAACSLQSAVCGLQSAVCKCQTPGSGRVGHTYIPTYILTYVRTYVRTYIHTMYLLTEWEGRTGKYLARGHGVRTKRSEVRSHDREPNIFPSGPT